ncbi:MAG: hypothetical protein AABZ53_10940 [Planctomycetota bacterium]
MRDRPVQIARDWFSRIRRRALVWVVGIAVAAVVAISLTTIPTWPIVGIAVLAAATAVNTIASRLHTDTLTCLRCGEGLAGEKPGTYGVICKSCGSINQWYVVDPAERKAMPGSGPLADSSTFTDSAGDA